MDLLDDKGANGTFLERVRIVDDLEDLISRFIVMETAAKVFAAVICVNYSLTTIAEIIVAGNDRNR